MAGVPTTESLYVGFGATEFMLNMELEKKVSESNPNRIYNLYYTCSKCTEEDTACSYTCPGHEDGFVIIISESTNSNILLPVKYGFNQSNVTLFTIILLLLNV